MPSLVHFTIVVRGRAPQITNLRDAQAMAAKLLNRQFEGDVELKRVAEMTEEAIAGHQTPTAVFKAMMRFAQTKGILGSQEKSEAWEAFSKTIGPKPMR